MKCSIQSSLETQVEIAWVFRIDAEGVGGCFGISRTVGRQPFLCISLAAILVLLMQRYLRNLLGHRLNVIHNQFVQIAVRVPSANLQGPAN